MTYRIFMVVELDLSFHLIPKNGFDKKVYYVVTLFKKYSRPIVKEKKLL